MQCHLYAKAKAALEQIEAIYWSNLSENNEPAPVLRTAPLSSWLEWGTRLLSMYTQDLALKHSIVGELSRLGSEERTKLLLYLNAWLTSPLVDPSIVSEITSMANAELAEATTDSKPSSAQSTPSRSPSAKTSKSSKSPSNKSSKVVKGSAAKK